MSAQPLPTRVITEQIKAIRNYAKEHDSQKALIRGELLSAYEQLKRPGTVIHLTHDRRPEQRGRRAL